MTNVVQTNGLRSTVVKAGSSGSKGVLAAVAGVTVGALAWVSPFAGATGYTIPRTENLHVFRAAAANSECGVSWAIIGAIAGVSSNHGLPVGTPDAPLTPIDLPAADVEPLASPSGPVVGQVLDGEGGRLAITDTDGGSLDNDLEWDRPVGQFQFIPQTWVYYAVDGDGDGIADPQNLADGAATAAAHLCDVGAATNLAGALTVYFGTDAHNGNVLSHASELQSRWDTLYPPPPPDPATEDPTVFDIETAAGVEVETTVVAGIRVNIEIGPAVEAMVAAAAADGIHLAGWGWRSHAQQIELRHAHCADAWETPSSECNPPTATPGNSKHEFGLAIDFHVDGRVLQPGDAAFAWLVENAATFGFYNLPSEPWHWSIDGT